MVGKYHLKKKGFQISIHIHLLYRMPDPFSLNPFPLPPQIYFLKSFSSQEGKCYRYPCQHISICECWCEYLYAWIRAWRGLLVAWESFGQEADGFVAAMSTWCELRGPVMNAFWAMFMINSEYVVQSGGEVRFYKWVFQYLTYQQIILFHYISCTVHMYMEPQPCFLNT